ncbi:hypothetical protein DFH06DRAFT_1129611 [Mycena polygramma]|nr:hypothetical protein DFH06DRAFT_1129611 [Mycena polygramma]
MSLPPPTALPLLAAVWALRTLHTSSLKHRAVARASQSPAISLGSLLALQDFKPFKTPLSVTQEHSLPSLNLLIVKPPHIWPTFKLPKTAAHQVKPHSSRIQDLPTPGSILIPQTRFITRSRFKVIRVVFCVILEL